MNISYEEAISRCWAEVDLSQLVQNYRNALAHLTAPTQLICVLKSAQKWPVPTSRNCRWKD